MATRINLSFANLNLDDYHSVNETLGLPDNWPDGLLAHGAGEVDGVLSVTDVWESSAHFDRFAEGRLGAAIGQALGDRAEMPQRQDTELDTWWAKSAS